MKPCRRGHTGGRYASGACRECMALRKGRKGRTVPLDRIGSVIATTKKLGKITREELKLRREKTRLERQELRIEARKKQEAERQADLEHFREKERTRLEKNRMTAELKTELTYGKLPAQSMTITQSPAYQYETRTDGQGNTTRKIVVGHDGVPLRALPMAVEAPEVTEPQVETLPAARADDKRPPWLQRGESIPRDKKEWLAWQKRRTTRDPNTVECVGALLPIPGMSGPNGVRAPDYEVTTGWNGTLSGL